VEEIPLLWNDITTNGDCKVLHQYSTPVEEIPLWKKFHSCGMTSHITLTLSYDLDLYYDLELDV